MPIPDEIPVSHIDTFNAAEARRIVKEVKLKGLAKIISDIKIKAKNGDIRYEVESLSSEVVEELKVRGFKVDYFSDPRGEEDSFHSISW